MQSVWQDCVPSMDASGHMARILVHNEWQSEQNQVLTQIQKLKGILLDLAAACSWMVPPVLSLHYNHQAACAIA